MDNWASLPEAVLLFSVHSVVIVKRYIHSFIFHNTYPYQGHIRGAYPSRHWASGWVNLTLPLYCLTCFICPSRWHIQQQPQHDSNGQPGVSVVTLLWKKRLVSDLSSVLSCCRHQLVLHSTGVPSRSFLLPPVLQLLKRGWSEKPNRHGHLSSPHAFFCLRVLLHVLVTFFRQDSVCQRKLDCLPVVCKRVKISLRSLHVHCHYPALFSGAQLLSQGGSSCSESAFCLIPEEHSFSGSKKCLGHCYRDQSDGLYLSSAAQENLQDCLLFFFLLLFIISLPALHVFLSHLPPHLWGCVRLFTMMCDGKFDFASLFMFQPDFFFSIADYKSCHGSVQSLMSLDPQEAAHMRKTSHVRCGSDLTAKLSAAAASSNGYQKPGSVWVSVRYSVSNNNLTELYQSNMELFTFTFSLFWKLGRSQFIDILVD